VIENGAERAVPGQSLPGLLGPPRWTVSGPLEYRGVCGRCPPCEGRGRIEAADLQWVAQMLLECGRLCHDAPPVWRVPGVGRAGTSQSRAASGCADTTGRALRSPRR